MIRDVTVGLWGICIPSTARFLSYQQYLRAFVSSCFSLALASIRLFFFLFVVNFVIHWNETAMGLHVFPIQIPPPTSLSTRSP